jgi:hypothetical protein
VALQGTIETFALPDVMRLLASTKKTGCLRLTGTRGSGSVWVDTGAIVASEASGARHAGSPVDVFFELLRYDDGDFVFDADVVADEPGKASDVESTLEAADKMLTEWRSIEAVVPSLDAWVELAPELTDDEITIDRDRWRLLVTVAAGTTVGSLGDTFELGELAVSRQVKELVEAGVVKVGDAPADARASAAAPIVEEPRYEPEVASEAPAVEESAFDDGSVESGSYGDTSFEAAAFDQPVSHVDDLVEAPDLRVADVSSNDGSLNGGGHNGFDSLDHDTMVGEAAPRPEPVPVGSAFEPDPTDAAEIARQLANLSPKAAKAVAAAAKATTVEEREAALAEVDDDEDPINRELLIKFLGSVNS